MPQVAHVRMRNHAGKKARLRRYGGCFHNPLMRGRLALAFGVVAITTGALVVACDLEVDTKYGPHAGLQKSNLPNPPPADGGAIPDGGFACGTPVDAGTCSVSYASDIGRRCKARGTAAMPSVTAEA